MYFLWKNCHVSDIVQRFGALKSDSTHHFFGNACTKSGSLRFSQFSSCWLILSVYILIEFWLSLWKIVRSPVILLLPIFVSFQNNVDMQIFFLFPCCYNLKIESFWNILLNLLLTWLVTATHTTCLWRDHLVGFLPVMSGPIQGGNNQNNIL